MPADIEFLLDSSGSVQATNFAKVRAFVAKFANDFEIGPNGVQIGVAVFDTHVHNEFWMNQHLDRASLLTAINAIRYPAGSTHTDEALQFARQNAFTAVRHVTSRHVTGAPSGSLTVVTCTCVNVCKYAPVAASMSKDTPDHLGWRLACHHLD